MNKKNFFLLCVFILSRVIFINPLPVFFDSPEYLNRFLNPNYFQAIASGHLPFHVGYIMLFWPIFQTANILDINPSFSVVFAQIIFSAIAIYCFYRFTEILTNKKIAIIAALISALTPLYWITNITIMTESTYINFFLISLFFLTQHVKEKSRSRLNLFIGCVSLGLSLLTNPLVFLWTPPLLSVMYFLKKEKLIKILLSIILTVILVFLINGFFIAYASRLSFQNGIYQYLFQEDIKIVPDISSLLMTLRFIRNFTVLVLQNNTTLIIILSIVSLIKMFNKNKKILIVSLFLILPIIITSQWYDPLLFGRHGIIAGFGFALLTGFLLQKRKILTVVTITYVAFVSLPALILLKQPIPYIETAKFAKTLPEGLLIETHFARPQIENSYSGEIIFINQPEWSREILKKTIDNYLDNKKPIFITSQALSDPYGIYSGPFLYPLSLSYAKDFELKNIAPMYLIKKHAAIDGNAGLIVYEIVSKQKSKYPDIPKLNRNRHRIDYFDPVTQLWFFIERAMITQSHNIIKG